MMFHINVIVKTDLPVRFGCVVKAYPDATSGYALVCCDGLHEYAPSSTLLVLAHHVTKDGSPTHYPALLWSFHATTQASRQRLRQGEFRRSLGY